MTVHFIYPFSFFCGLYIDIFEYAMLIKEISSNIQIIVHNFPLQYIKYIPHTCIPFDDIDKPISLDDIVIGCAGYSGDIQCDYLIPTSQKHTCNNCLPKGVLFKRLSSIEPIHRPHTLMYVAMFQQLKTPKLLSNITHSETMFVYPVRDLFYFLRVFKQKRCIPYTFSKNQFIVPKEAIFVGQPKYLKYNRLVLELRYFGCACIAYDQNLNKLNLERFTDSIEKFDLANYKAFFEKILSKGKVYNGSMSY